MPEVVCMYLFIIYVFFILLLKLYLNFRQIKSIKLNLDKVPDKFLSKISIEEHQNAGRYNIVKLIKDNLSEIFSAIILLIFTIGGGIDIINNKLSFLQDKPFTMGVSVILVFFLVNYILTLPFTIYETFKIEQSFGFNNTTIKIFIMDVIKGLIITAITLTPLLYLVLWLMQKMTTYWWIYTWLVLVIFNLFIMIIYPTLIAPLFNKFTELEDVVLRNRINKLLSMCGFKSKGIFVMDGSKRTNHGNAYFTGIGKSKRIVFFDTLIKNLNHNEIEAVLAHELGHFKKKHILKSIIISFITLLFVLFLLSLLIKQVVFFNFLGVSTVSDYNALILFSLLPWLVGFIFKPLFSFISRKNEFEADQFAAKYSNRRYLISGLVKLYKDNASTLTPDHLYASFYYSHPPASIRIKHLENIN